MALTVDIFFISFATVIGIAAWLAILVVNSYAHARQYKFPPRVPGLPLIGNTLQYPTQVIHQAEWGARLAKQYGEMRVFHKSIMRPGPNTSFRFTLRLGSSNWVFLNSSRTVIDILEKQASITSSKPDFPFAFGVMSAGRRILWMPYGDRWRELRKHLHSVLNSRKMINFSSYQDTESKQLIWEFLHHPDRWYKSNQRYTMAVIVSVVFGRRPMLDDPNMEALFQDADEVVQASQPGQNIVDVYPQLARLPKFLQWWRPKGERLYKESLRVYNYEVDRIKALIEQNKAPECFAVDFLESTKNSKIDEIQKTFVMGTLLEAGSDTTRVALSQMLAATIAYPDWVGRAQVHLDRVCGANAERLPTWEDKPNLQFISAVVKEGFRWRPMAPVGVPHVLTSDLRYEDYHFPAGTIFAWNSHYIALSPDEYEDPERFWPERFLNKDVDNVLQGHWSFGPGRRVCAGYNVAQTNAWMAMSRLLYCFKFEGVPGKSVDTFRSNWLDYKKAPFALKITPRSLAHAKLIEEEFATIC
ncbi:Cytochrome P450-like protein 52 [Elsinoe fawcettii]|nr:Cytochrome P450-like protein 52 [Elsinoe fawcettii]